MKRKIRLRGELVIMMLISLFLSFGAAIFIRNQGIGVGSGDELTRKNKVYAQYISKLEEELMQCDLRDEAAVWKLLQDKYSFLVGYTFYIVDGSGRVMIGSNRDIEKIDAAKIVDGKVTYETSQVDKNVFKMSGCDYLKDECYLYYTYLMYEEDDTGMVAGALMGALVCFFLLIWPRISYISSIRTSVGRIAEGDLSHRVPYRYKNELRGLAEDINHMTDALESQEQKKNEFLTNISHDIRTPLTTIIGYLEMIRKGKYDSKEEMAEYMEIMQRKGTFLAAMLEDFFQYSKLASKDIKINDERFELNELLRQFYEDEEDEFKERKYVLQLELYKQPIYCNGDTELLARVVNNLLMNALKYSKAESNVYMRSSLKKIGHTMYGSFTISNRPEETISEKELECLFERLYKRDCARGEEGSGLGLSIVKNIIKLHDGIVRAYKEGDMLTFEVLLKLQQ